MTPRNQEGSTNVENSASRPFVIHQMQPGDAAEIADLTSQLGYPANESAIKRRYDLIKDRPDARLLVAKHVNGTVVGWIHVQGIYMLESDPRAAVWGLVVAESARGLGVGRALMEAAEQWAVAAGLTAMAVNSNTLRVHAKGFYEHLGYTVAKTQNAFRKDLS